MSTRKVAALTGWIGVGVAVVMAFFSLCAALLLMVAEYPGPGASNWTMLFWLAIGTIALGAAGTMLVPRRPGWATLLLVGAAFAGIPFSLPFFAIAAVATFIGRKTVSLGQPA